MNFAERMWHSIALSIILVLFSGMLAGALFVASVGPPKTLTGTALIVWLGIFAAFFGVGIGRAVRVRDSLRANELGITLDQYYEKNRL